MIADPCEMVLGDETVRAALEMYLNSGVYSDSKIDVLEWYPVPGDAGALTVDIQPKKVKQK